MESRKQRENQRSSAAAAKFFESYERAQNRKPHEPHSGITLQVLLEQLESFAPTYTEGGSRIAEYICRTLFPLCRISKEEIPAAMEQIEFIQKHCSHMLVLDIASVEQKLKSLSERETA